MSKININNQKPIPSEKEAIQTPVEPAQKISAFKGVITHLNKFLNKGKPDQISSQEERKNIDLIRDTVLHYHSSNKMSVEDRLEYSNFLNANYPDIDQVSEEFLRFDESEIDAWIDAKQQEKKSRIDTIPKSKKDKDQLDNYQIHNHPDNPEFEIKAMLSNANNRFNLELSKDDPNIDVMLANYTPKDYYDYDQRRRFSRLIESCFPDIKAVQRSLISHIGLTAEEINNLNISDRDFNSYLDNLKMCLKQKSPAIIMESYELMVSDGPSIHNPDIPLDIRMDVNQLIEQKYIINGTNIQTIQVVCDQLMNSQEMQYMKNQLNNSRRTEGDNLAFNLWFNSKLADASIDMGCIIDVGVYRINRDKIDRGL